MNTVSLPDQPAWPGAYSYGYPQPELNRLRITLHIDTGDVEVDSVRAAVTDRCPRWVMAPATPQVVHAALEEALPHLETIQSADPESDEYNDAVRKVECAFESVDQNVVAWNETDWSIDDLDDFDASSTDEDLSAIADHARQNIWQTSNIWIPDILDALTERRNELRDELREHLNERLTIAVDDLRTATEERDAVILALAGINESSYSIAETARLSPSTVLRIIRSSNG